MRMCFWSLGACLAMAAVACEVTPAPSNDAGTNDARSDMRTPSNDATLADARVDFSSVSDAGDSAVPTMDAEIGDASVDGGPSACGPYPTDYTPRTAMSATDSWPACISDPGEYVRFRSTIPAIDHVDIFERLFASGGALAGYVSRDPNPDGFAAARFQYLRAGLDAVLAARADERMTPTAGTNCPTNPDDPCACASIAAAQPNFCTGPAALRPILLDNLNRGVSGDTREPSRVYAARMEAALLWFLYLSADASALRCTTGTNACDAAYAYYTGGVSAFTVPATPDGGVRSDGGVSTDGGTRDGALADSSIDGSMVADASSGDAGADGAVADAASSVDATVDLGTLLDAARDSGMGDAGAPMPILTRGGLGLGRLVRGVDLATHDRVWDGLLAVRCWRDLDRASPATDLTLRDRARAQLNLALTRGIMLILDARLSAFASSAGDSKRAHHAFLRTLLAPIPATSITDDSVVPPRIYAVRGRPSLLDARIRQISASDADFIATEILKPAERVDAGEIAMRLARLFPCS